jgi:hypothetical protein
MRSSEVVHLQKSEMNLLARAYGDYKGIRGQGAREKAETMVEFSLKCFPATPRGHFRDRQHALS